MLLDGLVFMANRCELSAHRNLILGYAKERLGLGALSSHHIKLLGQRLNTAASGYVIPRRCGKTSYLCTLASMFMIYPDAGVKALYTAQREDLCKVVFETTRHNLMLLVQEFNALHLEKHKEKEAAARQNKQIYREPILCAALRIDLVKKIITVNFYLRHASEALTKLSENRFVAKVYNAANALRGSEFNLMLVDETNFLSPKIFPELIPNLLLRDSKMICSTSQKNGQDSRPFVDLRKVRMDAVLSCVIEYVCPNHCTALIKQDNLMFTTCSCYMFAQPLHINVVSTMRRLLQAFSTRTGGGGMISATFGGSSYANSKDAILSEIGIIPPGFTTDILDKLNSSTDIKLLSEQGERHFLHSRLDLLAEIVSSNNVHRTVLTYLDPTPSSYRTGGKQQPSNDPSKHAMVTVTAMKDGIKTRFVVIGVEEFSTEQLEPETHDSGRAMASVYMAHISTIHHYYNRYFTEYFLVPEVNSFDLDNMWYNCRLILNKYAVNYDNMNIYAPCIVVSENKRSASKEGRKRKAVIENISLEGLFHRQSKKSRMDVSFGEYNLHEIDTLLENDSRSIALSIDDLKKKLLKAYESNGVMQKFKLGYHELLY